MFICEIYNEKGNKVAQTPKFEHDFEALDCAADMIEFQQNSEYESGMTPNLYDWKLIEIKTN